MRLLGGLVAAIALVLLLVVATGGFAPNAAVRSSATPSSRPSAGSPGTSATPTPAGTFTLTEAELTKAAQDAMPVTVGGITVSDPKVRLEPGKVTLTATGRAFIVSGPIVVVATPVVANGAATARIESATFAGVALPDSTKRDVADTFTRVLAGNIPAGVRVTSVSVGYGSLTVQSEPR